jgi:hypothetical protein
MLTPKKHNNNLSVCSTLAKTKPFKDNPNAILKIDTKVGGKTKTYQFQSCKLAV